MEDQLIMPSDRIQLEKFPLPEDFFPPIELSEDERQGYKKIAHEIREETWHSFGQYKAHNRIVPETKFKKLRSHGGLSCYRLRKEFVTAGSAAQHVFTGFLPGTVEMCMYGSYSDNTKMFRALGELNHRSFLDGAVLHQINEPAEKDQLYHFFGLRWMAKTSWLNLVSLNRDMFWLEDMDIVEGPNGVKYGYKVLYSVNRPECPEFLEKSLVRAKVAACYLFTQYKPETVEVYMKGSLDIGGRLPQFAQDISISNQWFAIGDVFDCALAKRLTEMLQSKGANSPVNAGKFDKCGLCKSSIKLTSISHRCTLCCKNICNQCTLTKPYFLDKGDKFAITRDAFCKSCILEASDPTTLEEASSQAHDKTSSIGSANQDLDSELDAENKSVHSNQISPGQTAPTSSKKDYAITDPTLHAPNPNTKYYATVKEKYSWKKPLNSAIIPYNSYDMNAVNKLSHTASTAHCPKEKLPSQKDYSPSEMYAKMTQLHLSSKNTEQILMKNAQIAESVSNLTRRLS